MTGLILEEITFVEDLLLFSKAYKEGKIKVNVSKIVRSLGKDRRNIPRYLNGHIPTKIRNKDSYLDQHRDYIFEILIDEYQSFDYLEHLFKYLKRAKV